MGTPSPPKYNNSKAKDEKTKQKTERINYGNRSPKRKQNLEAGKIEVTNIIKSKPTTEQSNSIVLKCLVCRKWDIQRQQSLNYQEVTMSDDIGISKFITEENVTFRQEILKFKQEGDFFKKLLEIKKNQNSKIGSANKNHIKYHRSSNHFFSFSLLSVFTA